MSKLIDMARATPDYEQYLPSLSPGLTLADRQDTDDFMPVEDLRQKHTLKASLFCSFVCNSAQYEYALENARLQITCMLYQEMVSHLMELKSAIYAGDSDTALKCVNACLDETR